MAKIVEHETVEAVENPETGVLAYPAMTRIDRLPVLASGAVEDCACDVCVAREADAK